MTLREYYEHVGARDTRSKSPFSAALRVNYSFLQLEILNHSNGSLNPGATLDLLDLSSWVREGKTGKNQLSAEQERDWHPAQFPPPRHRGSPITLASKGDLKFYDCSGVSTL